MDGRDALLAVAMNGSVLPVAHGFPVRMVVPGLYGYVSACKWITDIEVTTYAAATAYWTTSAAGPSRHRSRPSRGSTCPPAATPGRPDRRRSRRRLGPAQGHRRGRGPSRPRRLAAGPARRGPGYRHLAAVGLGLGRHPGHAPVEARATDKTGYTQTPVPAPPEPNGASGYPTVSVTVT